MWITNNFFARKLVWLAVLIIPAQGLQASSCGCSSASSSCQQGDSQNVGPSQSSCCCGTAEAQSCCTTNVVSEADCCSSGNAIPSELANSLRDRDFDEPIAAWRGPDNRPESSSGCQCGDSCQCSQTDSPTVPVSPVPVENQSVESNLSCLTMTVSTDTINLPRISKRSLIDLEMSESLDALDRCVSLCRFTL